MTRLSGIKGKEDASSNVVSTGTVGVVGGITLLIVLVTCLKLRKKGKSEKPFGGGAQRFVNVKVDDDVYEEVNTNIPEIKSTSLGMYEDIDLDYKPKDTKIKHSMEDGKELLNVIKSVDSTEDPKGHNEDMNTVTVESVIHEDQSVKTKQITDPRDHQYTQVVKKW